jgi:hypothetical protein
MRQLQEQLLEWGKTWPISHRQPGAVLPPPPLSPTEIHAMCRPNPRAQSPLHLLFITAALCRQRNMSALVSKVRSAGGSCGVGIFSPALGHSEGRIQLELFISRALHPALTLSFW